MSYVCAAAAAVQEKRDRKSKNPGRRRVPCHRQWHWYFVRRVNYMAHSTCQIPHSDQLSPTQIWVSHANFHPEGGWKARDDDIIIIIQREIPKGSRTRTRARAANYFKFQPISNDFLSHMWGLHGGSVKSHIGIAIWYCIVSANRIIIIGGEGEGNARRLFWLMLKVPAGKSPNQSQILPPDSPRSVRFDSLEAGEHTLHPRSYFVIFHRETLSFSHLTRWFIARKRGEVWGG